MKSKSERVVRGNRRRVVAAGLALCVAGLFTPKSETDVLQAKSLGTEVVGYCALKSVQSNNKGGAEIKVEWSSPSGEAPFDPRVTPAFSGGGLEPTSLDLIEGVHDGRVVGTYVFQYYPRIDLDGLKGPAPESGWVMVGHDYCGTIKVMDGVGVLPFSE